MKGNSPFTKDLKMIVLICIGFILYSIVILVKFISNLFDGKGCGNCTGCKNITDNGCKGGYENCD